MQTPRANKWALLRISAVTLLAPWLLPVPWQTYDKPEPHSAYLTPAAITWCEHNGGCP